MKINAKLIVAFTVALVSISAVSALTTGGGNSVSVTGSGNSQGNYAVSGDQATGYSAGKNVEYSFEDHWIEDTIGNKATVSAVIEEAEEWYYDYYVTLGNDKATISPQRVLEAHQTLDVENAELIWAVAAAQSTEGNFASTYAEINSKKQQASLDSYSSYAAVKQSGPNKPDSYDHVTAHASASHASSNGMTKFRANSINKDGAYSSGSVETENGYVNHPSCVCAQADDGAAWTELSFDEAAGSDVFVDIDSGSGSGESSSTSISVPLGSVYDYSSVADGCRGSSDMSMEFSLISSEDQPAIIQSRAQNSAPAHEEVDNGAIYTGTADFIAKRSVLLGAGISSQALSSDLDISTYGMGKNALILEPFRAFFGENYFYLIGTDLVDSGYAVTDYADSGVSWEKVDQLDEYTVSIISTHGLVAEKNGDTIGLVISNTNDGQYKTWHKLKPMLSNPTSNHKMLILDACSTFHENADGTTPGRDAVENSYVSGGWEYDVPAGSSAKYMDIFIYNLCNGYTTGQAQTTATKKVKPLNLSIQGGGYPDYILD